LKDRSTSEVNALRDAFFTVSRVRSQL